MGVGADGGAVLVADCGILWCAQALLSVFKGSFSFSFFFFILFFSSRIRGSLGVVAHGVDAAVAAVLELALAVRAGLCCEGTGEEDEAEADDGDHIGCWDGDLGMIGRSGKAEGWL